MKRRFTLLLSLILLFFITNLSAQDVEVEWGKEQQHSKKGQISGIIGNDENGYYALRSSFGGLFSKTTVTLIRYNMQHEIEFESDIRTEVPGGKGEWEGMYLLKDNLVAFFSRKDSKKDKNILYHALSAKMVNRDSRKKLMRSA